MPDDFPDKVIPIRTLRIQRNKQKHCQCYEWSTIPRKAPQYEIDTENREIICKHCGNVVDAFEALLVMSRNWKNVSEEVERLYERAKEIQNYKPWLRVVKEFEKSIDRGKMVPVCPHCEKGILLEELNYFRGKEYELNRRSFEGKT